MSKSKNKPILTLDFDGVIHSYTSGWKGATIIPDPPVKGAIDAILNYQQSFTVAIHSSRSHQGFLFCGGRRAMQIWLRHWAIIYLSDQLDAFHQPIPPYTNFNPGMDPVEVEMRDWADNFIHSIKWPLFKPPSLATLDDRAMRFDGEWPTVREIFAAKPWYK